MYKKEKKLNSNICQGPRTHEMKIAVDIPRGCGAHGGSVPMEKLEVYTSCAFHI